MSAPPPLWISCGPDYAKYILNNDWKKCIAGLAMPDATLDTDNAVESAIKKLDKAETVESAIQKLDQSPSGVFVADAGFTTHEKCNELIRKLVTYAEGGGKVVFGALFAAVVTAAQFNAIFPQFGANWEYGGFELKEQGKLNLAASSLAGDFAAQRPLLPSECNLRQLLVRVQSTKEAWYVFANPVLAHKSGVVMKKVGKGWVGFVGERDNSTKVTQLIFKCMFQLVKATVHSD